MYYINNRYKFMRKIYVYYNVGHKFAQIKQTHPRSREGMMHREM